MDVLKSLGRRRH